jgi:DNA-binding NarL/FixJ family response regulator
MAQMPGYDPDELNGISLFDLLPDEEHSAGRRVLSHLASGNPAAEVNSRFIRKDGTVCDVEWNAAPAGDDHLIYAAARDISSELTDDDRRSRQNAALVRLDRLSPRERQVAEMVVAGKANKVIARELDLSQRTVETHRANLMKKLKLSTTAELIRLSLQSAD